MTSLHTKYRPKNFSEVIGQEHIVPSLKRAVRDKRAKAFMFSGPSGTGKTSLARVMANQLQATVIEVAAAENTGVDNVREIIKHSHYKAVGASPNKAIILDESHRLTGNAWDALLKPIEEPPRHVYWFLCTTNEAKIPATIKTRCQSYKLQPVEPEMLFILLDTVAKAEGLGIDDAILEEIAEGSNGSPRQALVYLETCAGCKTRGEAKAAMITAVGALEAVDLARWLVSAYPGSWGQALKYVKKLQGMDAEGIRITIVNYIAAVILSNQISHSTMQELLAKLEPFLAPYNSSDKMAPLLYSLSVALGCFK